MSQAVLIRQGQEADLPAAHDLIKELAVYEKAPEEVETTVAQLARDGFGEAPLFQFLVAEVEGEVVGMALYFFSYSTWKGKCVYLEDLVVKEAARGRGVGKALFDEMVRVARREKAYRLMWQVLDWNDPAIHFYREHLQAELDPTWINCRLTQKQLEEYPLPD